MAMNKKGNLTLAFVFIVFSLFTLFIFAFFAPAGVLINEKIYEAGESLMLKTNASLSNIQNTEIRNNIQGQIQASLNAQAYAVEANNNMYRYSWIIIIGISGIVMFLYARSIVEQGRGSII